MNRRLTLHADDLWVIRSVRTPPAGESRTMYYETPSTWNKAPTMATIFTTYEAAAAHLTLFQQRDAAPKGWADGSTELLDVVPLWSEIQHSPNGVSFTVKKRG